MTYQNLEEETETDPRGLAEGDDKMPPEICTESNHRAVFGDRSHHSENCCFARLAVAADILRANDCRSLHLKLEDLCHLSDLGLELMGAYINRSIHLEDLTIGSSQIGGLRNVRRIGLLFAQIKNTVGLKTLAVEDALFSMVSADLMLPFLSSSSTLLRLNLPKGVSTEIFNSMIKALDGRPIQEIQIENGTIDNIDVLGECRLPDLSDLDLSNNDISRVPSLEKCPKLQVLQLNKNGVVDVVGLGQWLKEGESCLRELYLTGNQLDQTKMDSLIHCLIKAQTLEIVDLVGDKLDGRRYGVIGSKGAAWFLELVIGDVRNLDSVLESNHVVRDFWLKTDVAHMDMGQLNRLLDEAVGINKRSGGDPIKAGRHKAIKFYLNGETRRLTSQFQGTDTTYEEIFSTFPIAILPEILSMVYSAHGGGELYKALRAVAPDLLALVDRDSMAAGEIERRSVIVASLDEKIAALVREREVQTERQRELREQYKLEQGPQPKRPKYE